jgi:tyrosyl-tRNA synthetase
MDISKKMELFRQVGEEIVTEEDLKKILEEKKNPVAYDGFEPSGKIHIAQAVLRAINVNKVTSTGTKFKMLVADWHGWANKKMGGNLDKIKIVGEYFIEVWKASGMDLDNVEFVWASDLVKDEEYWGKIMRVAINSTVKRILRCGQIMGRKEEEVLQASQILYPCMQCADIFHLNIDICQLGMDQRKVNMLAREIGPKLGFWKPAIVSHHMLMGLSAPPATGLSGAERGIELKMSKSKPDTAIFMADSEEEIKKKLNQAYCPEKQVIENPILEYYKYIIFERFPEIKIERPEKFGGNLDISGYDELAKIFGEGKLHPMDLKNAAANYVNQLIEPVRKHFEKGKAQKLFEEVQSFQVTR